MGYCTHRWAGADDIHSFARTLSRCSVLASGFLRQEANLHTRALQIPARAEGWDDLLCPRNALASESTTACIAQPSPFSVLCAPSLLFSDVRTTQGPLHLLGTSQDHVSCAEAREGGLRRRGGGGGVDQSICCIGPGVGQTQTQNGPNAFSASFLCPSSCQKVKER